MEKKGLSNKLQRSYVVFIKKALRRLGENPSELQLYMYTRSRHISSNGGHFRDAWIEFQDFRSAQTPPIVLNPIPLKVNPITGTFKRRKLTEEEKSFAETIRFFQHYADATLEELIGAKISDVMLLCPPGTSVITSADIAFAVPLRIVRLPILSALRFNTELERIIIERCQMVKTRGERPRKFLDAPLFTLSDGTIPTRQRWLEILNGAGLYCRDATCDPRIDAVPHGDETLAATELPYDRERRLWRTDPDATLESLKARQAKHQIPWDHQRAKIDALP